MKKTFRALVALAILVALGYGALVAHNNRKVPPPSVAALQASREKATQWLLQHREEVLAHQNPALWWMIGQSAQASGDGRVQALFDEFRQRYSAEQPQSIWQVFFEPGRFLGVQVPPQFYQATADYQQLFLFGMSCGRQLVEEPVLVAQGEPDFCRRVHPISPACVTHQLMGYRFMQRSQCFRVPDLERKVALLQDTIVRQLTWDPRVVDVYIQRVLMLTDSGAAARIKPRWLQRVLDAQLADGSWSSLQPLLPLGGGRYFGFAERLVGVERHVGNLHATAQGLWLMSLQQREMAAGAVAPESGEQERAR